MAKKRTVYTPEHFEVAVEAFAKAFGLVVETALTKVGLQMHDEIVAMTPRDTGLAQAAWRFTVDRVDPSFPPPGQYPRGAANRGRSGEAAKIKAASTINISNNLPYILPLEHGHSQQAPQGMVALTVARAKNWMVEEAKRAAKEEEL